MQRLSQKQIDDIKKLDEELVRLRADYQDVMGALDTNKMALEEVRKQMDVTLDEDRTVYSKVVKQHLAKGLKRILIMIIGGSLIPALICSAFLAISMHNSFAAFLKIIPSMEFAAFITWTFIFIPNIYYVFREYLEDYRREKYFVETQEAAESQKEEERLVKKGKVLEEKREIIKAKLNLLEERKMPVLNNNSWDRSRYPLPSNGIFEETIPELKFSEDSLVPHHKNYAKLVPLREPKLVRTKLKKGDEE